MPDPACIFLPGIVMPAAMRYEALFGALGGERRDLVPLDLLIADEAWPAASYSIAAEIAALDRVADAAELERFHLYGHSGGGAVALAYAAARPDRLLSVALDEPSTDFSAADLAGPDWTELRGIRDLPLSERLPAFRRLQVAPGVPVPLPDPLPAWIDPAPGRIVAFTEAAAGHRVAPERYRAFRSPVHYTYGSLTRARYEATRDRLAALFPRLVSERYEGLHHLHCAHQGAPDRVAAALRALWREAEA
ncbi:MAG: alpha/beta fold hydrolase [Candidatus Limnocylindria bacterium]